MVFVVAEIGVNWDGNFDLAKDMMYKSKLAGCDAVKFQAFEEELVKNHPEKSRLMKSSISEKNIKIINDLAKSIDIEWFCTPMYPEAVDMLDPYVKRFKMRVSDGVSLLENKRSEIFERISKTGKKVFVSSEKSPKTSTYYNNPNISWLYCVPKYPCDLSDLNFRNLKDFQGFSNHCPQIIAPLTAAILGAEIIEVHITSDRSKDYADNNVSFDYSELNDLVRLIRSSKEILT